MNKSDKADRAGKPRVQDLLGLFMCVLGGLCSVSILLSFLGRQPKESWLTAPVVGLRESIGPWPGLIFSVALAVLGTTLFLATRGVSLGRHLAGIGGLTLGVALLVGAFSASAGGAVGGALPATIPGMPGGVLALAVGVTLLLLSVWLTWLGAEPSPRLSLAGGVGGGDVGALDVPDPEGVSAAESAALLEAPAPPKAGPATSGSPGSPSESGSLGIRSRFASPGDVRVRGGVPPGTRPLEAPQGATPKASEAPDASALRDPGSAPPPGTSGGAGSSGAVAASGMAPSGKSAPRTARGPRVARKAPPSEDASAGATIEPPTPFWEEGASTASAGETAGVETPLPAKDWEQSELFDAVETAPPEAEASPEVLEEVDEVDDVHEEDEEEPDHEVLDQSDEDDEDDEEDEDEEYDEEARDADADADEEDEDEAYYDDEEDEDEEEFGDEEEDRLVEESDPAEAEPDRRVAAEPAAASAAPDAPEDLVYEAGRLILAENRVAVSMLERHFGIEFQRACEVLDELQSLGLIGPYIGGRTRDILLSPEDWAAQAPGGKR